MAVSACKSTLFVTGKGGTGKSSISAAIALVQAESGLRTLVAEVHNRTDVLAILGGDPGDPAERAQHEEIQVAEHLFHVTIDSDAVLGEYLSDQLPGPVAAMLGRSRSFGTLAAATPGLRELLTVGKIWEMAQEERRLPGAEPYDLVVVDAPATGHGVALLSAPRTFAEAARSGPVARQAGIIDATLSDPEQTAVIAVATAEELPVSETIELSAGLPEALPGQSLERVVVNRMLPRRFSKADADKLRAATGPRSDPAIEAALAIAEQSVEQQTQLARLRRELGGIEITTAPALPADDINTTGLRKLGKAAYAR